MYRSVCLNILLLQAVLIFSETTRRQGLVSKNQTVASISKLMGS